VPAERLLGEPVAAAVRRDVRDRLRALGERVPTLATVLMSDDPADERFVELKHDACDDVGIATRDVRIAPDAPASRLHGAVERLSADPGVDAVFVQVPLPDHVRTTAVGRRIDPAKDVDCFHPETLGRLVAGDPRYVPATAAAVRRLLAAYDVDVTGRDVVVVGRSTVIGRPLANLLFQPASGSGSGSGVASGDATVTVCHSRTRDLGAHTRRADVLVTACGVPRLVDGSMLSPGVTVVDVSANRVGPDAGGDAGAGREATVVGDVDVESVREVAGAITPVPGGVGPVTLAALLANVVRAAER
jgi:methylenetetrahydrofolate dehydrogenase (NADP+)/methenyltetrahydrofolate cyclohydrolase